MTLLLLFISLFLGINIRYSIAFGVIELVILFLFVFFKLKRKKLVPVLLGVALIGVGLSFIGTSTEKKELNSTLVVVSEVKENYYLLSRPFSRYYVYEPSHSHEVGDILLISGEALPLDFTHLESEFDFKEYLNHKGVFLSLDVTYIEVKFFNPIKINQIKKNYLSHFDENTSSLVSSILFSNSQDSDLTSLMRELHLVRLISTSGVYLYFFSKIVEKLLGLFIKKKKIVDFISVISLLPHLVFTFPRFVVIRFIALKSARWINNYVLKKKISNLSVVSIVGIFFLLIDPFLALQDGFVLSNFISLSVILYNGSILYMKKWKKRLLVSGFVTLSFIPFMSNFYSELSPITILVQILITPIFLVYYFLSILSFLGVPIYQAMISFTDVIYTIIKFVSTLAFKIYISPMNSLEIFFYESLLFIFVYYLSIKLKPVVKLLGAISLLVHVYILFPVNRLIVPSVSFINVGQGDSTLISYHNFTVMIDTGGLKNKDVATEVLIPYLKKKQIYKIDYLITTHNDFDHVGGVSSLLANFTVKQCVSDYQSFPIKGNNFEIKNYNIYPELWKEENDCSLVLSFKVSNYTYLVMGDAPKKIENRIMKDNKHIDCDVLKVGHHGSKTSTSDEFIKYLRPKYGIISCGKNNSYGHPHKEVLAILKKYGVIVKRTDLEGTITF